jgi:hypothetical protein
MSGTEKTIDQFAGWEDSSQQHDFFGETNLVEDVVSTVEKDDVVEEGDETTKPDPKKKEKEEQELIDEQFKDFESGVSKVSSDDDDNDEGDETKVATAPEGVTKVNSKSTLEFLKDKGLVDFELEEGQELTEDLAENLLEDSWEQAVEAEVEATIKDLPQEVKDLIKFASTGGDVGQLLAKMANNVTSGLNKNSDIESEAVQIQAVTTDLLSQGYDQEYIDTQIEFLKDSNKLEGISKKAFDKIIAKQEADTANEVEQATQQKEFRKKQAREYKTNITTHIGSLTEVGGLPVSKQDKAVLPTYISEPTVELQDGRVVSELQADLFKVMADKDKIVLLAKLLKSDFDFSAIARKQATTASRGIKEAVQNADKKTLSNGAGSHKPNKKALWDMLE